MLFTATQSLISLLLQPCKHYVWIFQIHFLTLVRVPCQCAVVPIMLVTFKVTQHFVDIPFLRNS